MHPPTHLAISWLIGQGLSERRDRRLVAWAGVVPDLDALSLLAGASAFSRFHHSVTHGIVAAAVVSAACAVLARRRRRAAGLALGAFHVHLLCDLLGSGVDWSIAYFWPFSSREFVTPYGWPLASWQNLLITVAALLVVGWIGVTRGRTFAETFLPARADRAVVEVLRRRFRFSGHDSTQQRSE
jgi:membrane-bound metal-dependent hydrolase YbcI (DUF457 family)